MSEKKYSENDPERTLITLDQLSQTIEVMTSVVNRLRQHLSEQVMAKQEDARLRKVQEQKSQDNKAIEAEASREESNAAASKSESVVVEVSQPESDLDEPGDEKTLH